MYEVRQNKEKVSRRMKKEEKKGMLKFSFNDNRTNFSINKSNPLLQFQLSGNEEENIFNWVRLYANDYLSDVSPGRIDNAANNTIRLRWFSLPLQGVLHTVGVNIHPNGWGGLWIFPNGRKEDVIEFHPLLPPRHNLSRQLRIYLINNVRSGRFANHPGGFVIRRQ